MTWSVDGRPVREVLVTRLRYLGDVAMSTVVPRVLRLGDPELAVDFLCEETHAPLLWGQPDCVRVRPLSAGRAGADARARRAEHDRANGAVPAPERGARLEAPRGGMGMVAALRAARYDLAIDLFFNPRSALLLAAAGVRARIGGARGLRRRLYTHHACATELTRRPRLRELAPGGLGDHLSRLAPLRHAETGLAFLDWLETLTPGVPLRPRVARPPLDDGEARRAMSALGVDAADGFVLLAPGATWPAKEWPAAAWRDLAARLTSAQPRPVLFLSPPARAAAYAAAAAAVPSGRGGLLPPLRLAEALRVTAAATLVIAVDGGIMHAAVAQQRPTLALFGPTDPALWFPYGGDERFRALATRPACHPCDRHVCDAFICLPDLRVGDVLREALSMLSPAERGA